MLWLALFSSNVGTQKLHGQVKMTGQMKVGLAWRISQKRDRLQMECHHFFVNNWRSPQNIPAKELPSELLRRADC
jgi:hypothetical protein